MKRKPRMQDVAALAGVASMTVSRVLSDSSLVTKETRARVLRAIKKLDYQPNPIARSLRQKTSSSIGIIVPNFYDPFFAICAHEISIIARQHGYSISVTASDEDGDAEFAEAKHMVLNHVRGIAVIPAAHGKSHLKSQSLGGTQIVLVDRAIDKQFNAVVVDNESGAIQAVQHLIEHRHERIHYIGLSNALCTMKERYAGYTAAMRRAGLEPQWSFSKGTAEDVYLSIRAALSMPSAPTAFFFSNNLITRYALQAFSVLQVRIPKQVAVIGFDDFEMANILNPSVTVIRQPVHELGRKAAEMLFSRILEKTESDRSKKIVLPVELVRRRSCGCSGDDALYTPFLAQE